MGTKFKRHLVFVFRNKNPIHISKVRKKKKRIKGARLLVLSVPFAFVVWGQFLLPWGTSPQSWLLVG